MLAYAADVDRVRLDLEAYAARSATLPVSVVLAADPARLRDAPRTWPRSSRSPASSGSTGRDFYHYGFLRLETLDLIRAALEAA